MKGILVGALVLWLAAGAQESVSAHLSIGSVMPDFLLVGLGCVALFGSRRAGAFAGFFAGLFHGAIAGANLGAYAASRTITGFLVGSFTVLEFEANAGVAFVSVAVSTLIGQILFMFAAPPPQIIPFLLATIGAAMYNGVLAIPLFALLKRVLDPPSR